MFDYARHANFVHAREDFIARMEAEIKKASELKNLNPMENKDDDQKPKHRY